MDYNGKDFTLKEIEKEVATLVNRVQKESTISDFFVKIQVAEKEVINKRRMASYVSAEKLQAVITL